MSHEAPADLEAWIKDNQRLIYHWVERRPAHLRRDEAYAIAIEAVWRGTATFDPARGVKFSSYISIKIRSLLSYPGRKRKHRKPRPISLDAYEDRDKDSRLAVYESDGVDAEHVRQLVDRLPARERLVITLRFGLDGERCKLEEVGDRIGLCKERVRQIEAKALERLRIRMGAA